MSSRREAFSPDFLATWHLRRYLRLGTAVELLGTSRGDCYRKHERGLLEIVKIDGMTYVTTSSLAKLLDGAQPLGSETKAQHLGPAHAARRKETRDSSWKGLADVPE